MQASLVQDARVVREALGESFDLAVVLGSGLGSSTAVLEHPRHIAYQQLGTLSVSRVAGHGGRLWSGRLHGWNLLVFEGRSHLYEGLSAAQVVRPVDLTAELGCSRLVLTNAAGGISADFRPGDFMFIDDHLNLTGDNPLRGMAEHPFIDVSRLYRRDLYAPLAQAAGAMSVQLHHGVLAGLLGPSYETPAEITMLERLGAGAVSMSTVCEAIKAGYHGMELVGISLISNQAAGRSTVSLNHAEVLAEGRKGAQRFGSLLRALIQIWKNETPAA